MRRLLNVLMCVPFLLVAVLLAQASAQDVVFSRTYGFASSSELGLCGNITSDGGYVIGGVSYHFTGLNGQFWLVRTDSNGDTLWTRDYGADRWQEAHYVIQTSDGGFALCGGTNVAVGDDDMWIVKTDALGEPMWTAQFGAVGQDDDGWAITQTSDDGYLAVGHIKVGGNTQLFMVRLDANGDSLWTKTYGGPYSDYGYGVVQTADDGFALTGTYSVSSTANTDLWLLRTNPLGDTLWTRRFDFHGNLDRGDQIVLVPDGGFAIGGRTWLGAQPQLVVVRTDSSGNPLWSREFGGAADEFAESIDMTPDGGFVIGGGAGPYPFDFYVARVSANGDSLWAARYDYDGLPGDSEDCYEIRVDANGDIMAFGYADILVTGADTEYWMLKIHDGALVQPGYLYGHVYAQDGSTPLEDVQVQIFDAENNLVGTDSSAVSGEFGYTLFPGIYSAAFSKQNYNDTTISGITIVSEDTSVVDVNMTEAGFAYLPGDANMYGGIWPPQAIGADITYIVNYLRNMPTSVPCRFAGIWASADVNGSCDVAGSDVIRFVNYLRGAIGLTWCPDVEPLWPTPQNLPPDQPPGWPGCE